MARRVWYVLVTALLVGGTLLAVGVAVGTLSPDASFDRDPVAAAGGSPHVDPATLREEESIEALRRQLSAQLDSSITVASRRLNGTNASELEAALGEDYRQELQGMVQVVENESQAQAAYNVTHLQDQFVTAVSDYRSLYQRYRSIPAGTEAAIRIAHQLEQNLTRVNHTARRLLMGFERVENQSDIELNRSRESIRDVRSAVVATQRDVRERVFFETRLSIDGSVPRMSFVDPAVITGRLVSERVARNVTLPSTEGSGEVSVPASRPSTGVSNATVVIRVGRRTITTRTNATGYFSAPVVPDVDSPRSTQVFVEYRPETSARFRGARSSIEGVVVPVRPALNVTTTNERVAYGDLVSIRGRAVAGSTPLGNVSVAVTINGVEVARTTTDQTGNFTVDRQLPATLASGRAQVRAILFPDGHSLRGATATSSFVVTESATELSVVARGVSSSSVRVSGRLTTVDGIPVSNRRLSVVVNGTRLGQTTTGPEGRYDTNVSIPENIISSGLTANQDLLVVEVIHDGDGSMLKSTSATDVAIVFLSFPWIPLLAVGGVVTMATFVLLRNRIFTLFGGGRDGNERDDGAEESDPLTSGVDSNPDALVAAAREQVRSGNAAGAIRLSYAAARMTVESEFERGPSLTPWELYRRVMRTDRSDDRTARLRRVTEAYERMAFADADVEVGTAKEIVADAERFVDGVEGGHSTEQ